MDDALGVAAKVRAGASAVALVEERLERIAASAVPRRVLGRRRRRRVRRGDGRRRRGAGSGRDPGPFAGVPVGWKDCFDVAGLPTTAGSTLYGATPAVRDAAVVARTRAAGGVSVGKLAMHELAWGMMGWATGRAPCPNPHDPTRTAGGSSTGSAVAVATGLVDLAPGTDSGGSVRVPASLCGVVGVKPTLGSVPLDGCIPYTRSIDHAGPIARSVRDCGAALAVLAAHGTESPPAEPLRRRARRRAGGALLRGARPRAWRPRSVPRWRRWRAPARCCSPSTSAGSSTPTSCCRCTSCEPLPRLADAVTRRPLRLRARRGGGRHARADADRARLPAGPRPAGGAPPPRPARAGRGRPRGLPDGAGARTRRWTAPTQTRQLNRNTKPFNGLGWPAITLPCGLDGDGLPVGLQLAAAPGEDWRLMASPRPPRRRWTGRAACSPGAG